MLKKRIALIGPGAMGEAVIAGALRKKLVSPLHITAAGPGAERLAAPHKKYGIETTTSNPAAAACRRGRDRRQTPAPERARMKA
jgi:pyrroline-5-carboxylate reductase